MLTSVSSIFSISEIQYLSDKPNYPETESGTNQNLSSSVVFPQLVLLLFDQKGGEEDKRRGGKKRGEREVWGEEK